MRHVHLRRLRIDQFVVSARIYLCIETLTGRQDTKTSIGRRDFNEAATSNFRVIDLKLGCVRRVALNTRYVTLSYVWGQSPMFRLQLENFERLSKEGSLDTIRAQLPKTVNDAIDLVKAMDERFLWVDGLCLVQDSEDDVTLGIEMMHSIYRGSYFTIVAGSGRDANAGLEGMGETVQGYRNHQIIKEIALGIRMTVLRSIDWYLSRSTYNRRGWTLQELVLPRRTVIFINGQVYFRCQEANWSEDSWADHWTRWLDADDSNISRLPEPGDGFLPSLWAYQKLCEDFSRRKLRSDGDALRALAGVTRPMASGMETCMVEGDLRRRSEFASFSWAGWEGQIMWPRENFLWYDNIDGIAQPTWETANILQYFRHMRVVDWKALDSKGYLQSLSSRMWELPSLLSELIREHPRTFSAVDMDPGRQRDEWQYHSISGSSGDMPYWDRSDDSVADNEGEEDYEMKRRIGPRRGFSIRGFELANGEAEFERLVQRLEDPLERLTLRNWIAQRRSRANRALRRMKFPPYTVLQFKTISMHLILGSAPVRGEQGEHSQSRLHTPSDDETPSQSPFARIPGVPLLSAHGQLVGSLHPDNVDILGAPGTKVECLVICRCNTPTVASALLALGGADTERPWDLLWILHVIWKDGIAERRGVGQVMSSAIDTAVEPKPEVKDVLLG
ncbi:hypothetical protein H2203_002682 [Taxawa tesnikishii (nom. ined.)]|nr:hypothetical protein H2203_002682 [Dothideales sp. JES 119]